MNDYETPVEGYPNLYRDEGNGALYLYLNNNTLVIEVYGTDSDFEAKELWRHYYESAESD